ncbi:MAG: hypothetical protein A2804_02350 [Candidatus Pacebacteria bacterium RIFCSPHIGHO2_01_FULL_46_10]|nr:MAG: hypothetical protein A2804_02350 [Candidatus Pacebacteria bacterium RIFCSPHIGHO2_01_FULL_46_10]
MLLSAPITMVPGVGDVLATRFSRLGIETVQDLLFHIPFRYEDFTNQTTIAHAKLGEQVSIAAEVTSITQFRTRRGLIVVKARIADTTGSFDIVWFNQPYVMTVLKKGTQKIFSGKVVVNTFSKKMTLQNPTLEDVEKDEYLHSNRRVPVYPETEDLSSRVIRTIVSRVLHRTPNIPDVFSVDFCAAHNLPSFDQTLRLIHFPEDDTNVETYKRRLAFQEVFTLLQQAKERQKALHMIKVPNLLRITKQDRLTFEHALPFTLSISQIHALEDLSRDLVQPYPSNRLIQGEVGSGKTVVAAFALYCAVKQGTDAIFIAPTHIVAHQHLHTLEPIFKKLGVFTQLITADHPLKEKRTGNSGTVYIGTHALFQHAKTLKPAVVVIDEEHRFGVEQRDTFWNTTKKPHLITMTATPIPRTVAYTVFADREVSYIEEIPEKRKHTTTKVIASASRAQTYTRIKKKILNDHIQVFIVCPFIQESEKETLSSIKAAEKEYETIHKIFADFNVALLHGKTPKEKRDTIFTNMRDGKIDILVSTPIIEVGVDIPNASIIIIEGAERFGLAQLHQLRGRVGRAGQEAFCLLFTSEGIGETKRLRILETHENGNELAELDLKLRGSGELLGTQQHGWNALKFASWFDTELIQECKKAVESRNFLI